MKGKKRCTFFVPSLQDIALRHLGVSPSDSGARRQFRKLSLIYGSPEEAEARVSQLQLPHAAQIGWLPPGVGLATSCPDVVASRFPREANVCLQSPGKFPDTVYICFAFLVGDDLQKFAARLGQLIQESPRQLQAAVLEVKALMESAVQSADCVVLRHVI